MVYTLRFFSSKFSLFHNSKVFGSSFIHILYTECVTIEKNNSGAKRLNGIPVQRVTVFMLFTVRNSNKTVKASLTTMELYIRSLFQRSTLNKHN